ncbi:MAG TPA: hypothetical protein VKT99_05790 [Xanthobacteraceae bacterium]|nr:hypothetical protein [Xanthobacteraceae bacterium]
MKRYRADGAVPLRRFAVFLMATLAGATSYARVVTTPALAHDIPADVKINAFFRPAGDRLELLVRLPLASLIDTDFPHAGPVSVPRTSHPRRRQGVAHRQYRRLRGRRLA